MLPEEVAKDFLRPILSRKPVVSEHVLDASKVLKEKAIAPDIVLKGRMLLFVKSRIDDGLRALAELSKNSIAAMLVTTGVNRFIVVSSKGEVMAAYLRIGDTEYLGLEALTMASQSLGERPLIQIFSLPEELGKVFVENDKTE